jgi:hypothetical protein
LVGKIEGNRPLGGLWNKCDDNIKKDITVVGCNDVD